MFAHQTFKLRKGSTNDFSALYFIYMHSSVNPFLTFEIMPQTQFKEIFNDLINSGQLYVYENSDHIAAACIVIKHKRRCNHACTLTTLAVNPNFHRQGIGTKFIRTLISRLKKEKIKRIDLYVETDNPAALRFYQKMNFQIEGVLKKYFKRSYENHYTDNYLMALILN